ncbi:hypothetical protein KZ779_07730 [Escherichia coli]|nr:hypothetical protein [Escherichia coli]
MRKGRPHLFAILLPAVSALLSPAQFPTPTHRFKNHSFELGPCPPFSGVADDPSSTREATTPLVR